MTIPRKKKTNNRKKRDMVSLSKQVEELKDTVAALADIVKTLSGSK